MMPSWKTELSAFVLCHAGRGAGFGAAQKCPPVERDQLRLIEVHDFDLDRVRRYARFRYW